MATTWTQQNKESGSGWDAGQSDITAGMDTNAEGQVVYAGTIGTATSWSLQNES